MKTTCHFTLFLAIFLVSTIKMTGQSINSQLPPPRVQATEVYVMGGVMTLPNDNQSIASFLELAPSSEILATDLSDYNYSTGFSNPGLGVFNSNLSLKFNAKDGREKRNPLFRVGVLYQGGRALSGSLGFETSTPYDTLISSQTGEMIIRDSIYSNRIEMDYFTSQVMVDVAVLWRSNPNLRWGVYGGIGFAAGLSFDNYTTIQSRVDQTPSREYQYYYEKTRREVFKNDNAYSALAYLPLGTDVSMGTNDFWKLIHLVVEMRPGISIIAIPELETDISAVFPVSFGWKVSW